MEKWQQFLLASESWNVGCSYFRLSSTWTKPAFERSIRLSCIKRPTKKFSFTLLSINRTKYNIFWKSGYFVTISKTTIRLMHQNYQFRFGKVLPNSVLSIKKSHACALEYGHNISIFCKFILCYSHSHHFRKVTVLHSHLWTY